MAKRELKFGDMTASVHYVHKLRQIGYEQHGKWDLGQICLHLTAAIMVSMDGRPLHAPLILKIIGPPILKPLFLWRRKLIPGMKAPRELTPPRGVDETKAVSDYIRAVERFKKYSGAPHPHAFMGKFTLGQWHVFHTVHAQHHLSFLSPR
ncbi:MAG: DUF1569 domain-containing protein [Planctomycetota bacterium]|nr:DUF1569 domain-containing protein [Planctomycetota bacterium]